MILTSCCVEHFSKKPQELAWQEINQAYKENHKNILQVINLLLSLPAGTGDCERGF